MERLAFTLWGKDKAKVYQFLFQPAMHNIYFIFKIKYILCIIDKWNRNYVMLAEHTFGTPWRYECI